mmetsp:Transcript_67464/g.186990  ORF Transcript_67464/g.186990 Transcript_67464/m.186990 type:complete len:410 (-) Transcript_67464:5-1234(-)
MLNQARHAPIEAHLVRDPRGLVLVQERCAGHGRWKELQLDAASCSIRLCPTVTRLAVLAEVRGIHLGTEGRQVVRKVRVALQAHARSSARGFVEGSPAAKVIRAWLDDVRKEHLHPACQRLVDRKADASVDHAKRAPEVQIRTAPGSGHKLVQRRQQCLKPPVEVVVSKLIGSGPDLLPVLRSARDGDGGKAAAAAHGVGEVVLHGIHERDVRHDALHGARGREVILDELNDSGAGVLPDELAEFREDALPVVVRGSLDEARPAHHQLLLALVVHEAGPQLLCVLVHVMGQALRNREPDHVRRQHQRVVVEERGVHRFGEEVLLREDGHGAARCWGHGLHFSQAAPGSREVVERALLAHTARVASVAARAARLHIRLHWECDASECFRHCSCVHCADEVRSTFQTLSQA